MLISPAYLELQRDLHARYDYGRGGDAAECAAIVADLGGGSVLDYGSGQGHLARILSRYQVAEYDPAIPGKDGTPSPADIVVCADVLEHIEPVCLDSVLRHIRDLSRGRVVLVIATGPSAKLMADGRGAHVIVAPADWWRQRLDRYFLIDRFEDRSAQGCGVLVIARPRIPVPLGKINVTSAVADSERNDNVRRNCSVVQGRLGLREAAHDRVAVLACYGPSLRQTWPTIAMAQANGADVFSVSGSHGFLIERGVVPYAHLDCDPREHKAKQFGEPHPDVKYWLASCVHQSYIDRLAWHDLTLWHSYNKEISKEVFKIDPGHELVVGGGSIGMRALSVLYCRGYRHFEIHGMDSCNAVDGEHHAGVHYASPSNAVEVRCGDRWFSATAIQIAYARYFFKSQRMLKGSTFTFHGNGLLAEMVKQGMKPGAVEDMSDDADAERD